MICDNCGKDEWPMFLFGTVWKCYGCAMKWYEDNLEESGDE